MEDTGAATESEDVFFKAPTTELQLKPIHIIVIIITVLHALAIALWVILFLPGEKGKWGARHMCSEELYSDY